MDFQSAFIEYFDNAAGRRNLQLDGPFLQVDGNRILENQTFNGKTISSISIVSVVIKNCVFQDVEFQGVYLENLDFIDCKFYSCTFYNCDIFMSKFENCKFEGGEFFDTNTSNSSISFCEFDANDFMNGNFFSCILENTSFQELSIIDVDFKQNKFVNNNTFDLVDFQSCIFSEIDFDQTIISNADISNISFINSKINDTSLSENCNAISPCFIDLQTILHSDINESVAKIFGLNGKADVKDYIKELTTELKFQSVFISYSFKDSSFAKYLNEKIRQRGLKTFLWEHNAPGGKRLKKIMKEYIHKHDKVLFIASENSLKSQACHFELSEARDIQDREWKDIYFPIHIDDYLFKLEKDDIRPKENRDEYWKNIEEIKDFNSVDFSAFRNNYENNPEFDEKVSKLVRDLRV